MGLFSRFEDKAEGIIEGSGSARGGGIEPVKLAKRAYKEMQREKMVGVGHEYAPTLYNVLLSVEDDSCMNSVYPSLAGEIETYLSARAESSGLVFDCPPLVRFIVDEGLKRGRFDIIAESVSPSIIEELRREEMQHYGIQENASNDYKEQNGHEEPAFGYSSRTHDKEEAPFDPLIPSDMQSASYVVPEEERAQIQANVSSVQVQDAQQQNAAQNAQQSNVNQSAQLQNNANQQQVNVQPAAQIVGQASQAQPIQNANVQAQANAQAVQMQNEAQLLQQQQMQTMQAQQGQQQPFQAAQMQQVQVEQQAQAGQIQSATPSQATTVVPQVPNTMTSYLYNFATQQRFMLTGNRVILGREVSCDIQINDPSVSRHHAELIHATDGWTVRDTGSTNGTSLNGAPITQSRIFNGDQIKLGNTKLQFQEG